MLVRPNSTEPFARREAGGKGFNLYRMSRDGLPVPPWVVVPARTYQAFVTDAGLEEPIQAALAAFSAGDVSARDTEAAITKLIEDTPLPAAVRALSDEAFRAVGGGADDEMISVRSSAADEDSAQHSFAGQLSSFLYVATEDDAAQRLKGCWASGFTERGLVYRRENGIDLTGIRVAVVYQTMIDPDRSGVLFTCDPIGGGIEHYVVSSVYGVGEGLVSGALDADTFKLNASDGAVVEEDLATKEEAFRRGPSGECKREPIPEPDRDVASLDAAALGKLHRLGQKLLDCYGEPQDVEFALRKGELFCLQTRPVTTLEVDGRGYPNLWDNSNIVESYGGLTSPLSFSFALHNYRSVYVQFCEILNVPPPVVKDMDYYLRNMLGCMNGRVFYNLYNWYKLVGVLPGFRQNRQFMETMMGVSEELSAEIEERVRPHPSWDTWLGKWRRVKTGVAFFFYHHRIDSIVERFQTFFREHYERYRSIEYGRLRSDEIFHHYIELDRLMLGNWHAPIINDFLCMVHFGMLKKLTAKWLADLDPNIQNDLLAGEGNLESAEPTKTLIRMAGEVVANDELKQMVVDTEASDLLEALNQSKHQAFYARVVDYVDRFGFRCMNEMKLEEIDLVADPTYLFVCLKNYVRSGTTDLAAYEEREQAMRSGAEERVRGHLSGWKKWVYFWSLKHARKAVKNRENTRFARTRIYGVARTMFRAMGRDLTGRGAIGDPEDIWYLTLEEVYGIHQGTLPSYDLKGLIAVRKASYGTFDELEPKPRFMTRGPVYWRNKILDEPEDPDIEEGADYDLKGLPCCPGVVEGVVKIVKSAADDLNLNGEILVTPRTDPGWVPLYPSVSGLLVERGSLLSHSAIVAREMGLPAVVAIKGLMRTLETGMRVRLDGKAGTVKILSRPGEVDDVADGGSPAASGAGQGAAPEGAEAATAGASTGSQGA